MLTIHRSGRFVLAALSLAALQAAPTMAQRVSQILGPDAPARSLISNLDPLSSRTSKWKSERPTALTKSIGQPDYGSLPLSFEANKGQTDTRVGFLARVSGYSLFLTPTEAIFRLQAPGEKPASRPSASQHRNQSVLRMSLAGANRTTKIGGQTPLPGRTSYFVGSDPANWRTNIATYRQVRCSGVYPGVDLLYYGSRRKLEYDLIVAPRADASRIALQFDGAKRLSVDRAGDLVVALDGQSMRWHKPLVYQQVNGHRQQVRGRFALRGPRRVGFVVAKYDRRLPLVIDPVVSYSTYLGGGASDVGNAIAVDRFGSAYIAGTTDSTDFPGASGPRGSGRDAFITRLDHTGSTALYSAYLGGSGSDVATGIKVDDSGLAYVTGYTTSPNFPTRHGAQAALTSATAAFVAVVNANGTDLVYGTLFGGNEQSVTEAAGIALDQEGSAWITGSTNSASLPIGSGFQSTFDGGHVAGFVAKFDMGRSAQASLRSASYFAAARDVRPAGIAVDPQGTPYICGSTLATDLPTTPSAFQVSAPPGDTGGSYAFVTRFDADCRNLLYSTYLSSARSDDGGDFATGIAVDRWGLTFVTGYTYERQFPLVYPWFPDAGLTNNHAPIPGGPAAGFLSTLDMSVTGANSLVTSTYLGGTAGDPYPLPAPTGGSTPQGFNPVTSTLDLSDAYVGDTRPTAVAVDAAGNPYVTGTTVVVVPASGENDAHYFYSFVKKFARAGRGPASLYTVLFGDGLQQTSLPAGLAIDPAGSAYVTGDTATNGLLLSTGAFQAALGGGHDGFVTKLSARRPPLDVNGDYNIDLLFQEDKTSRLVEWILSGTPPNYTAMTIQFHGARSGEIRPPADWIVVGFVDLYANYESAYLMQNRVTGDIVIWSGGFDRGQYLLNGGGDPSAVLLDWIFNPGANWKIVGTGDFDGNGHPDLLFQNSITGDLYLWYTDIYLRSAPIESFVQLMYTHGRFIAPFNPGPNWQVAAVADLNLDGRPDILFQNSNTGDLYVWYMNNADLASGRFLNPVNPGAGWKLSGTADLNQDGHPDLLFQNQKTGMLAYWHMHNADEFEIGLFNPAGSGSPDWKLVGPK